MKGFDDIQLDLPATHKYLNVLGACLREMLARVEGLPDVDAFAYNVQLAVHEVCTNVVDHAYADGTSGRIVVCMELVTTPRQLVVEVHDTGGSFDPSSIPLPNLDEGQVHGYGLFLIHQLMDQVTYDPRPDGNTWRLVKNL